MTPQELRIKADEARAEQIAGAERKRVADAKARALEIEALERVVENRWWEFAESFNFKALKGEYSYLVTTIDAPYATALKNVAERKGFTIRTQPSPPGNPSTQSFEISWRGDGS